MLTQRSQLSNQYWDVAKQQSATLFNDAISAFVFGSTPNLCNIKLLNNLWFYLDIIYQKRLIDSQNAVCEPLSYYRELYCIPEIIDALKCTSLEKSLIRKLIDVYLGDPTATASPGIGGMNIAGPDPWFMIAGGPEPSVNVISEITCSTYTSGSTVIVNQPVTSVFNNISSDTTFSAVVPAGYELVSVVFRNQTTINSQLSLGVTVGGSEAFGSEPINGYESILKGMTSVRVLKVFSLVNDTTLYLNHAGPGDVWGGAIYNLNFILLKV